MIDLYVYYKVRDEHAARLAPLVRALQQGLGLGAAGVKRRPGSRDGLQTWMEVYPGVDDDFPDRVAAAAAEAGLDGLIAGPRHLEVFTELAPCA